ncbi:hypothetical protein PV11_02683 [Exophiala sideris]|uniref:Metallo-beta-lactamase domain-containing protein n=1 Tax=Exophiala sideris TaxID=1016849 RepID=A0A0D1WEA2_9EURO|nr:hypothetical protein PV11_02683 [Exophiala sideris]
MGSTGDDEVYVTVSALEGGQLTLPERLFITDADPEKRATVPSLSFLIQHPSQDGKTTRLVFDLGLKRDLTKYPPAQQAHIANRQPTILHPDCADCLRGGGLDPAKDIDIVILSHVHWDHEGTPEDFSNAQFVVGSGTLHLLANGAGSHYPKAIFNPDLLPRDRTSELPPVSKSATTAADKQTKHEWKPFAGFPATVDFFGDGSVYVVDSPGHLFGHVNLLARIAPQKWVYLGGDCCHDPRILTGEKNVALYDDGHGGLRSVHVDTEVAKETLKRIGPLLKSPTPALEGHNEVEVIVAHDKPWREKNLHRFFPGKL